MKKAYLCFMLILAACSPDSTPPADPFGRPVTPTVPPPAWSEPAGAITNENVASISYLGRLDGPGTPSTVFAYSFSPDSTRLAGLNNEQLLAWDLITGRLLFSTGRAGATEVYYSPDKTEIYTLSGEGIVLVYDGQNGVLQNNFRAHPDFNFTQVFNEDTGWLAVGGTNGEVKVWDMLKRQSLVTFNVNAGAVSALALSHRGDLLAAGAADGTVSLWNWRSQQRVANFSHQGILPERIVFSPDDSLLAVGTNAYIALWSVETQTFNYALETGGGGSTDVLVFSPDSRYLASGGVIPDMSLWDTQTGSLVVTLPGIGGDRTSAAFSPDGTLLLAAVLDGPVTLWDMTQITTETITRAELKVGTDRVLYVDWTNDSFLMLFVDATGPLYLWGLPKTTGG